MMVPGGNQKKSNNNKTKQNKTKQKQKQKQNNNNNKSELQWFPMAVKMHGILTIGYVAVNSRPMCQYQWCNNADSLWRQDNVCIP